MRYIAYELAIFAAVFVMAFTTGYLPGTPPHHITKILLHRRSLGVSGVS